MTKERLKRDYNVDADKIKWHTRDTQGYKWEQSDSNKNGFYINKENDNYIVVDEKTNCVAQWRHDLSDLETT